MRKRGPQWSTVTIALAVIAAVAIAVPAFGLSGSIKKAIKKEVAKQVKSKKGPKGATGATGPQGPGALKLEFSQLETDDQLRTLGTIGGLTVLAQCSAQGGLTYVEVLVQSSSAGAPEMAGTHSESYNDGALVTQPPIAYFVQADPGTTPFISTGANGTNDYTKSYARATIFGDGAEVISLQVYAVANDDGQGSCQVHGTAVRGS